MKHCGYRALKEELMQDHIAVRLGNNAFSKKLQMDSRLTLEKVTSTACQAESIKNHHSFLRSDFQAPEVILNLGTVLMKSVYSHIINILTCRAL